MVAIQLFLADYGFLAVTSEDGRLLEMKGVFHDHLHHLVLDLLLVLAMFLVVLHDVVNLGVIVHLTRRHIMGVVVVIDVLLLVLELGGGLLVGECYLDVALSLVTF